MRQQTANPCGVAATTRPHGCAARRDGATPDHGRLPDSRAHGRRTNECAPARDRAEERRAEERRTEERSAEARSDWAGSESGTRTLRAVAAPEDDGPDFERGSNAHEACEYQACEYEAREHEAFEHEAFESGHLSPPPPVAPASGGLQPWRLRRVVAFIDANLAARITLSDMAAAAGLSRMHFAAQFRLATGQRPHHYLLERRILRAQERMQATRDPLVEIALGVGFQTQAHFTTVFRRLTGETPHQWRSARRAP